MMPPCKRTETTIEMPVFLLARVAVMLSNMSPFYADRPGKGVEN
jgi:hypothetical protein